MASERQWMVSEEELDDIQYQIRNLPEGNYLISGCAGSGKTVLALQKAKEIQDLKKGTYLVVVYTKVLRKFIEDGIKYLGLDPNRVYHYDDLDNFFEEQVDYVIVDEIQDFPKERIDYLVKLARKNIMFFGDDAQQLYAINTNNINLSTIKTICQIEDDKTYTLSINHRLPKKIAEFAEKIVPNNCGLAAQCERVGGDIKINRFIDFNSEMDSIINTVKNEKWNDVGILVSSNQLVQEVKQYFENKGIEVEYKYDIKLQDSRKETISNLDFASNKIKIMTYHSSKGVQFEHVFLPECSISTDEYNYLNALYVATTRCVETLFISYTKSLSRFIPAI